MLISLALSQLWRQSDPAELSSRWGRCYWNKMAERAGGAAEESWGNAEERVKGGEEFTPVSAVLPKEQHPRREGGGTRFSVDAGFRPSYHSGQHFDSLSQRILSEDTVFAVTKNQADGPAE